MVNKLAIPMANAKKAPAAAQAANPATPDVATLLAMIQQLQAGQAKAAPAAKPQAAQVDHGAVVVSKLQAAGGRVTRTGKSGVTPKGYSKAWVDVTIGGVRIQGNAFLTGK